LVILLVVFTVCNSVTFANEVNNGVLIGTEEPQLTYILPSPKTDSDTIVEKALTNRRSHRNFQNKAISADKLSQI
jgi:hypothetical protein